MPRISGFLCPVYSMAVQGESEKMPRINVFYDLFILWLFRENRKCQGSVVSLPCLFYGYSGRIWNAKDKWFLWPVYSMAVQGESEMPRIGSFYALSILWLFRKNLKCHGSAVSIPCLFYGCSGRIWNATDQWFLCPVYSMAAQGESEMSRSNGFYDLFILWLLRLKCQGSVVSVTCFILWLFRENVKCQGSMVSIPFLFYGCSGRI